MSPRILLTGKHGQVGAELARFLPEIGDLVAVDRHQLDLAHPDQIRRVIRDIRPQIIVNAAAYTPVDLAEKEEPLARAINTDAPGVMAEEARKIGAVLVHYSTDYVFDGAKTTPYEETDPTNPLNAYGRTKLGGEDAIRHTNIPYLILRTQWVYGNRGKNFLLTILRLAAEREELLVVSDQFGAPTWSREIASATTKVLCKLLRPHGDGQSFKEVSGTYNMTAAGQTNWHAFAVAILNGALRAPPESWSRAGSDKLLLARRIVPIKTQDYPTPARRPAYSVLSNRRLAETFGVRLPDWRTQLDSVLAEHVE
ncbi:MAG: dTDP-4-dehydrorhamnose reductase [Candidatus Sulfotelmatobacter sp.]